MRCWIALALLLPSLSVAAPTEKEWRQWQDEVVRVEFVDGTVATGTVIDTSADQVRLRLDDGSMTTFPLGVVASIGAPADDAAPAPDPAEPPPTAAPRAPRGGPSVGIGVGVGMGPVGVGISTGTGGSASRTAPVVASPRGRGSVSAVRYPLRGEDLVDFWLFDEDGRARAIPAELDRGRALREYVFVDESGWTVPTQAAWAWMDAERDYVENLKRMDRTLVPLRITETAMGVGGIGLLAYGWYTAETTGTAPGSQPAVIGGTTLIISNIVFNLAVTAPTRNRLRADIGREGLERAQDFYAPDR